MTNKIMDLFAQRVVDVCLTPTVSRTAEHTAEHTTEHTFRGCGSNCSLTSDPKKAAQKQLEDAERLLAKTKPDTQKALELVRNALASGV